MIKFKFLAVVAAAVFAASPLFAGDKAGCCAHADGAKVAKEGCEMTFASLNLNTEQKTKLEKAATDCHKGGCTEETMAKMDGQAKQILSKEQYATWKESHKMHKAADKKQS